MKSKQLNGIILLSVLSAFILSGCTGPRGPMGPSGPTGPAGSTGPEGRSGNILVKEYTGTITADGSYTLNVPEILDKRTSTYVLAYFAFPTSPDIWSPMSDGWLSTGARKFSVSWTYGLVGFYDMKANDLYLVQVFEY